MRRPASALTSAVLAPLVVSALCALAATPAAAQPAPEPTTNSPGTSDGTVTPPKGPTTSDSPTDPITGEPTSPTGTTSGAGSTGETASSDPRSTGTRAERPTLTQSGSSTPTPVIDGDIENVPNLNDLELAMARLTISAQKAQTNLSIAPFLIPGRYVTVASELRLGVSAGSDGAFGLGAAIGWNQPRSRLNEYAKDASFCEPEAAGATDDPLVAALDGEIEATLTELCGFVATACEGQKDKECAGAVRECASAPASASGAPNAPNVPGVLRLAKLIHRVELLKESGAPPTPPRRPDRPTKDEDYLNALAAYVSESAAFQSRRFALSSIRLLLPAARDRRERRERAGEEADLYREADLVERRQLCRLEAAYLRASLVTLGGSVSFFPLYLGPAVQGSGSDAGFANVHYLRRVDATLGYRFYASRRVSAQLRGGFRAERGDASADSQLLWRALAGADLGFFVPIDDMPDADGFQRGLGLGISGTAWFCGTSGGCLTDVGQFSPYVDATGLLPLSRRIQVTGFVEWRQSAAIQIRAGVEARIDSVVGPLDATDPTATKSPILTRVLPTIGLGSSFWGL